MARRGMPRMHKPLKGLTVSHSHGTPERRRGRDDLCRKLGTSFGLRTAFHRELVYLNLGHT